MSRRGPALRALCDALRVHPGLGGAPAPRIRAGLWPATIALANAHLLAPALFAALAAGGALDAMPAHVRDYLLHLYRANRQRNRLARHQLVEIVRELNREGIEPLLLKGALTLVSEPRFDPGSRMLADLDFAVPQRATQPALRALHRLGYRVRDQYPPGHHAYAEFVRAGSPAAIDLHFELIDQPYILPVEEVWRRARQEQRFGAFRVPWPTHRILHNVLHAQIHHRGAYYHAALDLRQLHDLAHLSRAYGPGVHWEYVRERLDRHRLATPLLSYLWAAHRMLGAPWPYARPPPRPARLHFAACRAQLRHPVLRRIGAPWGNVAAALAWHRMAFKYGTLGRHRRRWAHLRRVLTRHPLSFVVARLFRP
jgi:hypothetical protein